MARRVIGLVAAIRPQSEHKPTWRGHRECVDFDPKNSSALATVRSRVCLLTPVAADSKQRDSAEPSYEVKIEPGQRRADLMHCPALGKGPEVNCNTKPRLQCLR